MGGWPQVRLVDTHAEGFAAAVFPNATLTQLTTLIDHQHHLVGRDGTSWPACLPGEPAIAIRMRNGPAPDPAPVIVTADDLGSLVGAYLREAATYRAQSYSGCGR
ncbi:hypothetical protein HMPREF0290_0579 [Corynebacterium efficiens YS-314]|nr:hypothetical protein HMPREF0290_0579 [Corynebacterium efficiens YS-314]